MNDWRQVDWNTDAGRVIWWLRQWRKTGSYTSERALAAFWQIALQDSGEDATRAALEAVGLEIPAWLDGCAVDAVTAPENANNRELLAAPQG